MNPVVENGIATDKNNIMKQIPTYGYQYKLQKRHRLLRLATMPFFTTG